MNRLPTAPSTPYNDPNNAMALAIPVSPVPMAYTPGPVVTRPELLATSASVATTTGVPASPTGEFDAITCDPSDKVVNSTNNGCSDADAASPCTPLVNKQSPMYCGATAKLSTSAWMTLGAKAAPAPNADNAIPVASPLRSGNHFITLVTGVKYINPHPTPPNTPYPKYTNGNECVSTPSAVVRSAALQKALPTMPAVRGPTVSTHEPMAEVVIPRMMAAVEKMGRSWVWVQSLGAAAMTPNVLDMPGVHIL
mmetsp:Transcript_23942/g.44020  ORF Transcript_23942/g.44020 Transcript_23942/m.44020 type:complete len:252 (+) Transcript_23942:1152-1907(+)